MFYWLDSFTQGMGSNPTPAPFFNILRWFN
jgi:hypothetical protein